jgi:hypothetical protein
MRSTKNMYRSRKFCKCEEEDPEDAGPESRWAEEISRTLGFERVWDRGGDRQDKDVLEGI